MSEKEYNEFNTKKYNKQKGGFSDFRVENLIGKPYKNDMMGLTNLSGNFNILEHKNNHTNIGKTFLKYDMSFEQIKKNQIITSDDLVCLRPETEMPADRYYSLIGKKIDRDINPFDTIVEDMIHEP